MSAYQTVADAIEAHMPSGWKWVPFEPVPDAPEAKPDVTGLTLKIRSVQRLPQAPQSGYQITWVLTVTSALTSRKSADPALADDLLDFLDNLDSDPELKWMGWSNATKGLADSEADRLTYEIDLITITQKEA